MRFEWRGLRSFSSLYKSVSISTQPCLGEAVQSNTSLQLYPAQGLRSFDLYQTGRHLERVPIIVYLPFRAVRPRKGTQFSRSETSLFSVRVWLTR